MDLWAWAVTAALLFSLQLTLAEKIIGRVAAGPYYRIDVKAFSESLLGIDDEKIAYLGSLGVKVVILSHILPVNDSNSDGVIDFVNVKRDIGGLEGFKDLVIRLKAKGIMTVLEFIPNHSSTQHKWFRGEATREKYYMTKETSKYSTWASQIGVRVPGSAWSISPWSNDVMYLHQFSEREADLNYRNPDVIEAMNRVLSFWHGIGVTGFLLSKVSYLLEDLDKPNDQNALMNHPDNGKVVKKLLVTTNWSLAGNDGHRRTDPFAIVELKWITPERALNFHGENIAVVSESLANLPGTFTALDLRKTIEDTIKATPCNSIIWSLGALSSRPVQKFGRKRAQALTLVAALLPGQILLNYGDEGGLSAGGFLQPGLDEQSVKFLRELLHASNAFNHMTGDTTEYFTREDTSGVFVMRRRANGYELVLMANFGEDDSAAPSITFTGESTPAVLAATPNAGLAAKDSVTEPTEGIQLPANSAIVIENKVPGSVFVTSDTIDECIILLKLDDEGDGGLGMIIWISAAGVCIVVLLAGGLAYLWKKNGEYDEVEK